MVIHEANASAGWANKLGARSAQRVLAAVPDPGLGRVEVVGVPVRASITALDRAALRAQARAAFGFADDARVLLVFGGSQGAQSINRAVSGAAEALAAKGISVLHAHGPKNTLELPDLSGTPGRYVAVPYLDRMDLAYAAADLAICRSGAMTVAEVSAIGLPAVYVPLPIGNGEQRLNALPVVDAGGGLLIDDADLSPRLVADTVVPVLADPDRLQTDDRRPPRWPGTATRPARVAEVALEVARQGRATGRPCGEGPAAGTAARAHGRYRRCRDVRYRPHPAGPRGTGLRLGRQGIPGYRGAARPRRGDPDRA